jgi:hypothetical protein
MNIHLVRLKSHCFNASACNIASSSFTEFLHAAIARMVPLFSILAGAPPGKVINPP